MGNVSEVDIEPAAEILGKDFLLFRLSERVEIVLNDGECLCISVG